MSYSYIKSVFPNFEPTTTTNGSMYNSLPQNDIVTTSKQVVEANGQDDYYKFAKSLINETNVVESFDNSPAPIKQAFGDCNDHMTHILQCSKCKEILTKQLDRQNDKIRNEEIMELISYIVFGIFILLLIESLRKI
jgi:hypothetical protein